MIVYSGLQYHCSANESFDSIALAVYGNEKYASDLMIANPDYCGQTVFDGGEILLLPSLDVPQRNNETALANTIAPWKT
ncbi:MAG: hypothetical protein IKN04_08885 [Clostridia bacterium]|nr:hypothetical protein [Clostridia bacterium]